MSKFYRYRAKNGRALRLEATSYRVRDSKTMRPDGWIGQAHLWEDRGNETIVTPFWPFGSRRFASRDEADRVVLFGLVKWIDEGRPKLRLAGS